MCSSEQLNVCCMRNLITLNLPETKADLAKLVAIACCDARILWTMLSMETEVLALVWTVAEIGEAILAARLFCCFLFYAGFSIFR